MVAHDPAAPLLHALHGVHEPCEHLFQRQSLCHSALVGDAVLRGGLLGDGEPVRTDEELLALLRLLLVRSADRPAYLHDSLGEDGGVAEGKEAELPLR